MSRLPDAPRASHTLPERFRRFLERRPGLLPPGSTVLVALSGGPDSVALLHLLLEVAAERRLTLHAAHFDHGLRPEGGAEAERVARWSREWGVPCTVGRAARELRPTQAALREARYRFLRRTAAREGADRIATGHQADDQAETVLLRILRGTGLRGLGGIPLRRGPYVRPLLRFWRLEILDFLEEREVPYLVDPSNRDRRWARARIRHDVLPLLESAVEADVRRRLVALAREARRAERALEEEAAAAARAVRADPGAAARVAARRVRVARDRLRSYDPEIQARAVRRLARELGRSLGRGGTRAAVEFIKQGRSGAGIDLAENFRLWREFDDLWMGRPRELEPDETLEIDAPGEGSSRVAIGGRSYRVRWGTESPAGNAEGGWAAELRLDALRFPLRLRGPRPGDRLRLGRGTRKLKRLFHELRVPRSERPTRPVLVAGDEVLWAPGIGVARSVVPGEQGGRFFIGIRDA